MSVCASKRKAVVASLSAATQNGKKNKNQDSSSNQSFTEPESISYGNLTFCDSTITLSTEFFSMQVLDYLSKPDLVHCASLVSKSWNQSSKNPHLWTALTADIWKKFSFKNGNPKEKKIFPSVRKLGIFLQRPQFAKLKTLVPPDIQRSFVQDTVFDCLAKSCPLLEELDASGSTSCLFNCLVPRRGELSRLPGLFPRLQKLRVCMRASTPKSLEDFARRTGERLLELYVMVASQSYENALQDATLETLAESCPNLKVFDYEFGGSHSQSRLSECGPIALLQNCLSLQKLHVTVSIVLHPRIEAFYFNSNCSARGVKLYLSFPDRDTADN